MNKTCAYINCDYSNVAPKRTLFQFPFKNQKRLEAWVHNSGCSKSADNAEVKYLCEAHFDSVYIVASQRRKILLQTAVPFDYRELVPSNSDLHTDRSEVEIFTITTDEAEASEEELELDEVQLEEEEEEEEDDESLKFGMEEYYLEEEMSSNGKPSSTTLKVQLNKVEKEISIPNQQILKPIKNKRKIHESHSTPTSTAETIHRSKLMKLSKEEDTPSEEDFSSITFSEFIFKGEEYVQMPKRKYIGEIAALKKELEKYKILVAKIKASLNNF